MTPSTFARSLDDALGTFAGPPRNAADSTRPAPPPEGWESDEARRLGDVRRDGWRRPDKVFAQLILEASPNIVCLYSIPQQRFLYVSPQLESTLGYTPRALVAMGPDWLPGILHPDDIPLLREKLAGIAAAADGEVVAAEYRVRHLNGEWRHVMCRNVVFRRSAQGTVEQFLSTVNDVTAQKDVEHALRDSEQRYRTVVENQSELICHYLPDTTLTFVNEAYCRYFGRTREELVGRRFLELIPPEARAAASDHVADLIAHAGETTVTEHEVIDRDGAVRWQEWVDRALVDPAGNVSELQGIGRDVTDRRRAEEALRRALDEVRRLKDGLQTENAYLHERLADADVPVATGQGRAGLIFRSESMDLAVGQMERAAPTDSTVLILGETGTGKELFASAIHRLSRRSDRPFVRVNCSALPPHLIESELFGHERGAFSGATARRVGRFEAADGGTLFLDEVGDLPKELQPKLLRVLQEGEYERVGSSKTLKVNVRVIAATNRDLVSSVNGGSFRADLFYRLNVLPIAIPPLRDRAEDIPLLAAAFLETVARRLERSFEPFGEAAVELLQHHDWPGNVRELQNVVERAALNADGRTPVIVAGWLDRAVEGTSLVPAATPSVTPLLPDGAASAARGMTLEHMERDYISAVLVQTHWRVEGPRGAAVLLGLRPSTLRSRIKKLGLK